jgi:hypothetical protein
MARVSRFLLLVSIAAVLAMTFAGCAPSSFKLSATCNPEAAGSISPSSGTYDKGVEVDVTATPAAGYRFDHWEGGASGKSPTVQLTMDSTKKLTAYFTKTYTVSVSSTPANSGSVSPNGGTYDEGKEVTLAATPAEYYKFNGWSGDTSGSSDHVTITVDSNKTIVASFVKLTYAVQTQVDASGGGTIDPASGTFEAGTHVQITATPATGYRFDHWGGTATGSTNPLNLLVNGDKTVTAYFTKTYILTVSASPNGSCTVDPSSGVYDTGTVVTLTATALFPYAFDHWSGTDNDAANPTTVTMSADKSVTAYFTQLSPGAVQTVTGSYWGQEVSTQIQLVAGQWVQAGVVTNGGPIPLRILGPLLDVVKNLGGVDGGSFTFQANTTGTYYFDFMNNGGSYFSPISWTLNYAVYS